MTESAPDAHPPLPLHIDSTMRSCFASCPEKFRLEFIHGYRPPGLSIDLHAGACFATAIEQTSRGFWERGLDLVSAMTRAHSIFLQEWGDVECPPGKSKSLDRVWEAVEDYFRVYRPATDHVQPYFDPNGHPTFEYTFAIPLEPAATNEEIWRNDNLQMNERWSGIFPCHPSGSPFIYCGRFDMLGSLAGRPVIRDEKTTGRGFSSFWSDSWNLRAQFIGYTWACREAGIPLDAVVVRGVAIQKTQIQHAEAIKTYSDYHRGLWLEQLRRDLWRIRRAWDEGYFDLNLGDACTQYGNCIFMPVCQSQHKEAWLSNFEIHHWNPLLKNPIAEPLIPPSKVPER